MKVLYHILYPHGLGDDRFTYEGYRDAFTDLGHEVVPLVEGDDPREKLERIQPDLFITEDGLLALDRSAGLLRQFRARGGRVVLHGKIHRRLVDLLQRQPVADAYVSEIDPRREFPDFPPTLFHKMHFLAASKKYHFPTVPTARYRCDIVYVGANLPKKREAFRALLLPLRRRYSVRIYGADWNWFDRYLLHPLAAAERRLLRSGLISRLRLFRQVPITDENRVYSSAKISLNFHEKHPGIDLKTVNARTFKIPASGGFEICDYVPQLREFFAPDEVIMPFTEKEWFEKIDYYLKNEKERKIVQEKGTQRALSEHTFHQRVKTMLRFL